MTKFLDLVKHIETPSEFFRILGELLNATPSEVLVTFLLFSLIMGLFGGIITPLCVPFVIRGDIPFWIVPSSLFFGSTFCNSFVYFIGYLSKNNRFGRYVSRRFGLYKLESSITRNFNRKMFVAQYATALKALFFFSSGWTRKLSYGKFIYYYELTLVVWIWTLLGIGFFVELLYSGLESISIIKNVSSWIPLAVTAFVMIYLLKKITEKFFVYLKVEF
ncbi:MAG: hypothetical protein ABEI53_00765 [Candidatus Magasanikbacteria bacterium]